MYLGHIPFSIKNLKREICRLDMTFIGQILRSPCLLFTTHLRKINVFAKVYFHRYAIATQHVYRFCLG